MIKRRLIPVLLLKNGWLIQSKSFNRYQNLGNPVQAVKRLSEWGSDEIIYLDITKDGYYDINRNDQNYPNRKSFLDIMKDFSKVTFMPTTIGGNIKSIKDIITRLEIGADKVSINTKAINDANFIKKASREFGSQCLVVSVDVKIDKNNKYYVYNNDTKLLESFDIFDYLKEVQENGAGEILLNSVDRDGSGEGYDLELINQVYEILDIPLIACGGAGKWEHFEIALNQTKVDAVAAANIFHYYDQSVYLAKQHLYENNLNVRKPDLIEI